MSHTPRPVQARLGSRYVIERELGSGAMATVYLARDVQYDRSVALKVLRPELAAQLGPDRFLKEIRYTAKLNHPHIIPVYDSGESDGLLYYVMPAVDGETLRHRFQRERQLGIDEALHITRTIAGALAYAHEQNIVHRDVKPENILLHRGEPLIADFGIARAIEQAGETRLTATGVSVGTPSYMSPEQAGGESIVDARSDQYALATLLYEMLAGDPPFTGSHMQAVMSKVLRERPTRLRLLRDTIPVEVESAVDRALAKTPADRYPDIASFAAALTGPFTDLAQHPVAQQTTEVEHWSRRIRTSHMKAAALVLVLATSLWVARSTIAELLRPVQAGDNVQPARYLLMPIQVDAAAGAVSPGLLEGLQRAFRQWDGVDIVDSSRLPEPPPASLSARAERRLAREQGAGRIVQTHLGAIGPELRLYVALFDARHTLIADTIFEIVTADEEAATLDRAAAWLLFRDAGIRNMDLDEDLGTRSLPAALEFLRGRDALEVWDVELAVSHFENALAADRSFVRSALWQAQALNWAGRSPADSDTRALLARLDLSRLSASERQLTSGLQLLSNGAFVAACAVYDSIVDSDPRNYAGWFGAGECRYRDDAIVVDRHSPSGWSFRSSHHAAVSAYRRAFSLLANRRDFRSRTSEIASRILYLSANELRDGMTAAPDAETFLARPEFADTLSFVPYPPAAFPSGRAGAPAAAHLAAVDQQRQLFRGIAQDWRSSFPRSAHALEALAISQETMGDLTALATLREARTESESAVHRRQLAAREVLLAVKFGTPDGLNELARARTLADTLLKGDRDVPAAELPGLSIAAALTGRIHLAASLARRQARESAGNAPGDILNESAAALLVYAAFGAPADSIFKYESDIEVGVRSRVVRQQQLDLKARLLDQAASLAFPQSPLRQTRQLGDFTLYPLLQAQALFAKGDIAAARRVLADAAGIRRADRRDIPPAAVNFDAVYPEARLWAALGDTSTATALLDSTLTVLRWGEPGALAHVEVAAAFVQAMVHRADLAAALNDPVTAARWASAVATLWRDADPELMPVVDRMRRLARSSRRRRIPLYRISRTLPPHRGAP